MARKVIAPISSTICLTIFGGVYPIIFGIRANIKMLIIIMYLLYNNLFFIYAAAMYISFP